VGGGGVWGAAGWGGGAGGAGVGPSRATGVALAGHCVAATTNATPAAPMAAAVVSFLIVVVSRGGRKRSRLLHRAESCTRSDVRGMDQIVTWAGWARDERAARWADKSVLDGQCRPGVRPEVVPFTRTVRGCRQGSHRGSKPSGRSAGRE